jgi:[protein-PII] uridylyltransferase
VSHDGSDVAVLRESSQIATADLATSWSSKLERLQLEHREGARGIETARGISDAMDSLVLQVHGAALREHPVEHHALVALGGYGRQEMAPMSDVDLLFLFRKQKHKSPELITGVLHPLWDLGFDVGHSSRTVSEAAKMLKEDLESCTAMMDGRLLAGDGDLFEEFQQRLYNRVPKGLATNLQKGRKLRHQNSSSVQLLEPNLKESPGGLREINALEWALKSKAMQPTVDRELLGRFLDEVDIETLAAGRDFMWRVRHEMHFGATRRRDVLDHELQARIGERLGYEDNGQELGVERFMREYYLHARSIYHLVELSFERLTRRRRNGHRSILVERNVSAVDGEIVLPAGAKYFREDPIQLLRIFQIAQAKKLRLSEEAQRAVRSSLYLIDDAVRHSPEARDTFMRILRRKYRTAPTLRQMHELGVLGAYLPEFGALTCLVQYDIYHRYTVDEHTLVALDNMEALSDSSLQNGLVEALEQLERRELLYLSILLHDIGKSKREEHISCGIDMATHLLQRLDLPPDDQRYVLFLIEHHQDLVIIAQRRDLDDYRMIAEFASLFATMDWLTALYLLSYADLSAVASEAWTDWQAALLWELYHKTQEQLQSGMKTLEEKQRARQLLDDHLEQIAPLWPPLKVVAFQEHVEQLPTRYLLAYDQKEIETHLNLLNSLGDAPLLAEFVEHKDHTEILVATRDQRQLLAKICGALAVNDVNILRADVNTRDDNLVLDIFQVTDVDDNPKLPSWKQKRVLARLDEVLSLRLKAKDLLEKYTTQWDRRRKAGGMRPAEVDFENRISDRYTVIDVTAQDTVGLLYTITHTLGEMDLDIHMAIINTAANRAADAFYVVDSRHQKILNFSVLEEIRNRLVSRLGV